MAQQNIGYSREDRDLLIELKTSVANLRQDIYAIKDGISASVVDHETRIRALETSITTMKTAKDASDKFTRWGGSALIFIVAITEFVISQVWHH